MQKRYQLPLKFKEILQKKQTPLCSEEDSIKQYLNLILTTYLGEYRYDPDFGCKIWDFNYHNIHSVNKWKESIKREVTKSILNHENRLKNIEVQIQLINASGDTLRGIKSRQRILITIKGILALTNKNFEHQEIIFFSPLSVV